MYEVSQHNKVIDGRGITTWRRSVISANVLTVEVGTNGLKGGDSRQGSRTYVRIQDSGGTDLRVRTEIDKYGSTGFEVILGGDSELRTFIEALEFILKALKDGIEEI